MTIFLKKFFRWIYSYLLFIKFIKKNEVNSHVTSESSKNTIVYIQVWDFNVVPWYSLTIHLLLLKKGIYSTILLDDLIEVNKLSTRIQLYFIKKVLLIFRQHCKVIYLSSYLKNENNIFLNIDFNLIEKVAYANTIQFYKGNLNHANFNITKLKFLKSLTKFQNVLNTFLYKFDKAFFIIPGGIYGNSGILTKVLNNKSIKFLTFDSGESVYISSLNGIASQLADLKISYELIKNFNFSDFKKIEKLVLGDINNRMSGKHSWNIQKVSLNDSFLNFENVGFLIPLNIFWDGAALLIENFNNSYYDWLIFTIQTILENSNENITLRQHPDERHWWGRANFNFKEEINDRFKNDRRINFIDKDTNINTYQLIEKAKGIICYSSTIGIESYILGKNVAVGSNVYFSNYKFAYKINNKNDLIDFIKQNNFIRSPEAYRQAVLIYYLGQLCNWNKTIFTPNYNDFKKWVLMDTNRLCNEKSVKDMIESMISELPLSYINHKTIFSKLI